MRGALAAYQVLAWLGLCLALPVVAWRALRDARYRVGWGERWGAWRRVPRGGVWVHGASVGEMRAAAPLVRALDARGVRLTLSTTSPAGRSAAAGLLGGKAPARLLPLDLVPLVRRVLERLCPAGLVVVETELWPALLWEARRRGVPAVLVNARISDRTFPRYRLLRRWVGPLLNSFAALQAQSQRDAERLRALGAEAQRVSVGGNLKFDVPAPDPADPLAALLRRVGARGWRVLVAGSTHPGEEAVLLDARRRLEAAGHRVGLVLAPRHLERCGQVARELAAGGQAPLHWSTLPALDTAGAPQTCVQMLDDGFSAGKVVLVDDYGLLGSLYGGAGCAFVGGSLVPVGGHNLLEPLLWGAPVLFGPHLHNAPEIRAAVLARDLGTEVRDAAELADAAARCFTDDAYGVAVRAGAAQLFQENRGAVARALAALVAAGAVEEEG